MIKIRKKSVSGIVATLLLVILTITASFILVITIKKLVKSPPIEESLCLMSPSISIINACYNDKTKDTEIKVGKLDDKLVNSLEFVLEFKDETLVWYCKEECRSCEILKEGTKTYYIKAENIPQAISLRINNCVFGKEKVESC